MVGATRRGFRIRRSASLTRPLAGRAVTAKAERKEARPPSRFRSRPRASADRNRGSSGNSAWRARGRAASQPASRRCRDRPSAVVTHDTLSRCRAQPLLTSWLSPRSWTEVDAHPSAREEPISAVRGVWNKASTVDDRNRAFPRGRMGDQRQSGVTHKSGSAGCRGLQSREPLAVAWSREQL
jgi:hypothetical protein